MNTIAYLDCPTGIAGDMCLGALIHAGVPLDYLREKLALLGISQEYHLRGESVFRNTQQATKVYVDLTTPVTDNATGELIEPPTFGQSSLTSGHSHPPSHSHDVMETPELGESSHSHEVSHRHLGEIETLINQAKLPERVKNWGLAIFRTLAEAEGEVHGIPPEAVHFHEVGATDAIVDIIGTCLGLDWLNLTELYCSSLPMGGGKIRAAHGFLTVPTPAVLALWKRRQVPVYYNGIDRELVTPTGAAIVVTLAKSFGQPPAIKLQKMGLGAGSHQLSIPNILRLWIGEKINDDQRENFSQNLVLESPVNDVKTETIVVLETQIDDQNPQGIAYLFDVLLEEGVYDVFTQPILMKKSRLGVLLTVICSPEKQEKCEQIIFKETTTLGIRYSQQKRRILPRKIASVMTKYGEVRVKIAQMGETITNIQPEYEDCAKIARINRVTWREVYHLALTTAVEKWQNFSAEK